MDRDELTDWADELMATAELIGALDACGAVSLDLRPPMGFASDTPRIVRTAGDGEGPGAGLPLVEDNPSDLESHTAGIARREKGHSE